MTVATRMETVPSRGTVRAKNIPTSREEIELFSAEELRMGETSQLMMLACRLAGKANCMKSHWPSDTEGKASYIAAARQRIMAHPRMGSQAAVDRLIAAYKKHVGTARELLEPRSSEHAD